MRGYLLKGKKLIPIYVVGTDSDQILTAYEFLARRKILRIISHILALQQNIDIELFFLIQISSPEANYSAPLEMYITAQIELNSPSRIMILITFHVKQFA